MIISGLGQCQSRFGAGYFTLQSRVYLQAIDSGID